MDTLRLKRKTNKRTNEQTNKTWLQTKTQWLTWEKPNKTRHAPWLAVHTDTISTLWSHTHTKEREEAHVVRVAVQEGQIVLFLHSQTDKTDITKLCILTAPIKKRQWAIQGLSDSRYRRRRTTICDKEKSGLHAEWSEACVSKGRRGSDARHCVWNLQDSPFENSSFSFGVYSKTDCLLHRAIGDCFCDAVTDRLFLRVRAVPYLPSRGSRGGFIGKPLICV